MKSFPISILWLLFLAGPSLQLFCETHGRPTTPPRPKEAPGGFSFGDTLSFVLTDPRAPDKSLFEEKHPWIRLFEKGKDSTNRDLNPTLDFLKFARSVGKKKIRPEEDKAPGLIVTFRGLELNPNQDGKTYTLKLVGEFNATEIQMTEEEMKSLFSGRLTQWNLSTETSRSTGPTRYHVKTDLKLSLSLRDNLLTIHSLEGTGTITTTGFRSKESYVSPTVKLEAPGAGDALYEGRPGNLPPLPTIK